MKVQQSTGLIAATFTPMHADGSLDLARVPAIVEHLVEMKVSGMFVAGTTGEGASLTTQERCQVVEAFAQANAGRLALIVHVGHNSPQEAAALAEHAARCGANAISATTPSFIRPASIQALVQAMRVIANGAPKLPFYYYHIPGFSGVQLNMADFLAQGAKAIANLAGIKYTATAVHEYQACFEVAQRRFDCLWGCDEMLLSALATGAKSAVGSTYNYAAPIYHNIILAFNRGDLESARRWQYRSVQMVQVLNDFGGQAAGKAMMKMIDMDCGPNRWPLASLNEDQLSAMRRRLDAIGFFEWIKTPQAV